MEVNIGEEKAKEKPERRHEDGGEKGTADVGLDNVGEVKVGGAVGSVTGNDRGYRRCVAGLGWKFTGWAAVMAVGSGVEIEWRSVLRDFGDAAA